MKRLHTVRDLGGVPALLMGIAIVKPVIWSQLVASSASFLPCKLSLLRQVRPIDLLRPC